MGGCDRLTSAVRGDARHLPSNDRLHDLGSAVPDLERNRIHEAPYERQLVLEARPTVEQQAGVDGVEGVLGSHPLHHCRFLRMGESGVGHRQYVVGEGAGGFKAGCPLGEREGDPLAGGEGLAKRRPVPDVGDRLVDGLGGHTDHAEGDERPVEVERGHGMDEAGALLADEVVGGDTDVVEEDRPAGGDGLASRVVLVNCHAGEIQRDRERRDTAGTGTPGPGEDDADVRLRGKGGGRLLAGEDPLVAIPDRLGGDGRSVSSPHRVR